MRRTSDGQIKISNAALDTLTQLVCRGNLALQHPTKLDRADYAAMNDVLEAIGGVWSRKAKGHVFPDGTDAAAAIDAAVLAGGVKDPRSGDFFETGPALAADLVRRADVEPGILVYEPNAGHGAICDAICAAVPSAVIVTCEIDADRRAVLARKGYAAVHASQHDALKIRDVRPRRVVMNPPFSRQSDIDHVRHAHGLLRAGGRLVAVMSAGTSFRTNEKAIAFRAYVDAMGGSIEDLPEGSFKTSGTMVRTVVVTIPGAGEQS